VPDGVGEGIRAAREKARGLIGIRRKHGLEPALQNRLSLFRKYLAESHTPPSLRLFHMKQETYQLLKQRPLKPTS